MRRYELSDEQWKRIEARLPAQKPQTGRPNFDHWQIVNGIIWVLKSGAPWRGLPKRYGKVGTVSSRFYRWVRAAGWQGGVDALRSQADEAGAVDWELHLLEGSVVRAHQHAGGAKKVTRHVKHAVVGGAE